MPDPMTRMPARILRAFRPFAAVLSVALVSCGSVDGEASSAEQATNELAMLQSQDVEGLKAPIQETAAVARQGTLDASVPNSATTPGAPIATLVATPPVSKTTGTTARPLRVLLTGDSMTRGDEHTPGGARSFRGRLYLMLTAAGYNVDFLGSQNEPPEVGGDPNHDAWGGAWIGPGGSSHNIYDRMDRVLSKEVDPDLIVMALGWNSAVYEPALAADKYEGLVAKVGQLKPDAQLLLGTMSPRQGQTQTTTAANERGYREVNGRARDLAARSGSDKLHLVDLASGSYVASDYIDSVHWNQRGADKAAQITFDAIVGQVLPNLP